LIAETWSLSAVRPEAEHFGVVIEGVRLFPREMGLLLQATLLAAKRGFPLEAGALAERGVKIAKETADQDRFRLLAAALVRDTAPPTTAVEEKSTTTEAFILKKP
jgi:hypothetical protein